MSRLTDTAWTANFLFHFLMVQRSASSWRPSVNPFPPWIAEYPGNQIYDSHLSKRKSVLYPDFLVLLSYIQCLLYCEVLEKMCNISYNQLLLSCTRSPVYSVPTIRLLRGVPGGGVLDIDPGQPDVRRSTDIDIRPKETCTQIFRSNHDSWIPSIKLKHHIG